MINQLQTKNISVGANFKFGFRRSGDINTIKNTIKDRLTYCKDWKNSVDIYLANKQISKKTHQEYYKSKP